MSKRSLILSLVCVFLLAVSGIAQAQPWLVCDPQSDADGYIYTVNGGAPLTVTYGTMTSGGVTYAKIADLSSIPAGPFTIEVRAYRDDPTWGRLESAKVPFSSTRPSLGNPANVTIKK